MAYTISHSQAAYNYRNTEKKPSVILRFFIWAKNQDEVNHVGWVGISVTLMSAVLFPLTMAVVLLNGGIFGLIIMAMVALDLVVITNLAALPTRYTIPFLALGALIDITAIVCSFLL